MIKSMIVEDIEEIQKIRIQTEFTVFGIMLRLDDQKLFR